MEKYTKEKIKEYVDMLGANDLHFMQQILTFIQKHLKKTGRL